MSKWIEIEIIDFDITNYFKQVSDEFEWYINGSRTTLYIYKNTKVWMAQVLEILVKHNIPFVFIPCDYERYCKDITYKDSFDTFDYETYCNLNNLIHQQFEVEVSANEQNTNYWQEKFSFPFKSLKDQIHSHIKLAKPKQKYLNLILIEQWEDKNPFTFDPWGSDNKDALDVHIHTDKYFFQLNTGHEDYSKAQNIINDLEALDFDIKKSLGTFIKYDTKSSQDNRILCFMVDILSNKITHANNILENDVRINLRKAISSVKVILNNGHPSELLNLVAILRDILQQPNCEKLFSGIENIFSSDKESQQNAIVKLGKLYSGNYDREKVQSEIFVVYLDFYKKAILYFKNSGLLDRNFDGKT